jgi:hypothetical protein
MAVVSMKIVVRVRDSVGDFYPGPRGPGKTFLFSERLVLESINDNTNGVPPGEDARPEPVKPGETLRVGF